MEWQLKHDRDFNKPPNKRQALLDLLLDISKSETVHLSDADIRDEVNTFMYAEHDTMATSISWTLYAMGRYPEYQVRPIALTFNSSNSDWNLMNLRDLQYFFGR